MMDALQSRVMPSRIVIGGKPEVAEWLGVSISAVERYIKERETTGFPEADWKLAAGPVWRRTTISGWSRRTGYPKPLFNRKEE